MKHKQKGLARPCHTMDLFLVRQGVQCGNCLAVFESSFIKLSEKETEKDNERNE